MLSKWNKLLIGLCTALVVFNLAWMSLDTKCGKDFLSSNCFSGLTSAPPNSRLVFVTGLHHSGTTLLRHVIGTHSRISEVAEEMFPTREYLNSALYYGGACSSRQEGEDCAVIFKSPFNGHQKAPRLRDTVKAAAELKRVDIVAIVRDPVDVAWSVKKRRGGSIQGRLGESWDVPRLLGDTMESLQQTTTSAGKVHIHFVQYEALVANFEEEIKALFEAMDLPFERRVLKYYKRPIETTNQGSSSWWAQFDPSNKEREKEHLQLRLDQINSKIQTDTQKKWEKEASEEDRARIQAWLSDHSYDQMIKELKRKAEHTP